jgi:hypothetical protein
LYRFFVGENLDRFATARYNDPRPIWFYIPVLIGGLLPWSAFLLLWLRRPAHGLAALSRDSVVLRLILWASVPLMVFSVSVGKQPRYVLPCLVPLAVLLARSISERVRAASSGRRDIPLTVAGALAGATLLAVAGLLYRASPLLAASGAQGLALWPVLIAVSALAVILSAMKRSPRLLPLTLAAAAAVTLLAVHTTLSGAGGPQPVVLAAQAAGSERDSNVCACGAFLRNLPFYLRARTIPAGTQEEINAVLNQAGGVTAVIDANKLAGAETASGRTYERISETPYLNTALLRIDDFIHPDPQRTLQRVVVIRTR